jgi:hypothetical protein
MHLLQTIYQSLEAVQARHAFVCAALSLEHPDPLEDLLSRHLEALKLSSSVWGIVTSISRAHIPNAQPSRQ